MESDADQSRIDFLTKEAQGPASPGQTLAQAAVDPINATRQFLNGKVPGVGPRAVKVGNAAVYALSEMVGPEAMGQLAMLKVRVRFGTAQKEVEKAFVAAARELQLPREEVEELSVPDCGLTSVTVREDALGDYRVRVEVKGSDVEVSWFDGKGKSLKSIPAAVKKEHAEDWKDLQGDIKDLQALISAQKRRSRIELRHTLRHT